MGLFDAFRSAPAAPDTSAAPQGQAPAQQQAPAAPQAPSPAAPADSAAPEGMDFSKLWEPAEGESQSFNPADMFAAIDPVKISEATSKMNFMNGVTQEQMAAISEGGEGAMKALAQMLNTVGQTAFTQSLIASAELTKQALVRADGSLDSRFKSLMNRESLATNLTQKNPQLASPEVAPITKALVQQFSQKYPNASSSELQTMAETYLMNAASKLAGPKKEESTAADKGTDWELFLSGE